VPDNKYQFASIPEYSDVVECQCGQPLSRMHTDEEITCPECGETGLQEKYIKS
jgi:predicted RNA-binding Zn-ribbon protein involved in translation (DUF1610 family)